MQSQEYKIIHYDVGDFKDQNNNTWTNVLFEESKNEPIRWVVKDPSAFKVGDTVYGHIEVKTSQAGKPYNRFYREQRPESQQDGGMTAAPSPGKYNTKDDNTQESIARSVALKAAVDLYAANPLKIEMFTERDILDNAEVFLAWLQNTGAKPETPSMPLPSNEPPDMDTSRDWTRLHKPKEPLPEPPAGGIPFEGGEIPLDEPPY